MTNYYYILPSKIYSGSITGTCSRTVLWRISKSGAPLHRRRRQLDQYQQEGRPSVRLSWHGALSTERLFAWIHCCGTFHTDSLAVSMHTALPLWLAARAGCDHLPWSESRNGMATVQGTDRTYSISNARHHWPTARSYGVQPTRDHNQHTQK